MARLFRIRNMTRFIFLFSLLVALLGAPLAGWTAGFGINATRLIYPEGASSINVTVRNTLSDKPYLVQAAISSKQDVQTATPFTVTPPLFRLEPQSTNQLRIAFTGQPLSGDRESVFYLHATAIPTSPQRDPAQQHNDVQAQLRFGVGNIIKLFFRPASLTGSSAEAQGGLQFSRVAGGLKVTNPSPYFVNLADLMVNGQHLALDTPAALMLTPFGSHVWPVNTPLATGKRVQWKTINDTGGTDAFSATLP
ncbi:fimbrial biogenesis chaperone [Enterobacter bugandensis]|uniref:fimbrial biogenesis chaperone n=1 Tax=Enterobacter bugandensis TaxID=881260 RepID=UPI0029D62345|nr:molecular chaperone [Enterobacter bugandensis]MDX7626765.1 molecular chaperone [Enterobacter bugandensis]